MIPPKVSHDLVERWRCFRCTLTFELFFAASYVHPFGLVMIVLCDCFPDLSKTIPIILFVVAWIWVDHFLESGYLANWHHNCCSMVCFPMRWSNPYKTTPFVNGCLLGICLHIGNLLSQCSHWTYHHMFIFTPYNHLLSGLSRYDVGPPNLTIVSGLIPSYSHSEVESSTHIHVKSEESLGEKQMKRAETSSKTVCFRMDTPDLPFEINTPKGSGLYICWLIICVFYVLFHLCRLLSRSHTIRISSQHLLFL